MRKFAPTWRNPFRTGRVALMPADQEEFSRLAGQRRATVAALAQIEAQIRQQASVRGYDRTSRAIWESALANGRAPEIAALVEEGRRQDAALSAFAESRGFASPERLAFVCGLPSPAPRIGAALG